MLPFGKHFLAFKRTAYTRSREFVVLLLQKFQALDQLLVCCTCCILPRCASHTRRAIIACKLKSQYLWRCVIISALCMQYKCTLALYLTEQSRWVVVLVVFYYRCSGRVFSNKQFDETLVCPLHKRRSQPVKKYLKLKLCDLDEVIAEQETTISRVKEYAVTKI